MAVTPIGITRVSHNLRTMNLLETLRRNTVGMFEQQNRLATGRALSTPSDDPVAASQALKLHGAVADQEQVLSNLQHADLMMSTADESLTEVNDLLNQAEAIASQSIGAQAGPDERSANASVIASIRERLMAIGNRQLRGSYLFAGRDTKTAPIISALGGVAYLGDTGDLFTMVGKSESQATNVPGSFLFSALSAPVGADSDLSPELTADTRLEDLSGANGRGIRKGAVVLTLSGGASVQVNLAQADTVGDVVDMVNDALDSLGSTATLAIDGNGIALTGSGVTIRDTRDGAAAADLGILTPAAGATTATTIADLKPRVTPNTALAGLNNGDGVELEGGIRITNGGQTAVIDVSDAVTIQDVINRINAAGLYVDARVNQAGTGIEVVNRVSGAAMSISDDTGTVAASLGIRTMDESTPLSALNFGRGVEILTTGPDLHITARSGEEFDVDLDGATTVGDVLEAINQAAADANIKVEASISPNGAGILIADTTGGSGALTVARAGIDAFAVDDLGLNKTVEDPDADLIGDDVSGVRPEGVFTALTDLEEALASNDEKGLGESAQRIVKYSGDVTRVHGIIGARAAAFRDRVDQTENAVTATKAFLSNIEDLDYTEAVTRFQQAQTALQANLASGSKILNLSLLDFLS